jgi:hypothetical protein
VRIEVQRRAVQSLADSNGWEMAWLADEGGSGAVSPEERKRFVRAPGRKPRVRALLMREGVH